MFIYEWKNIRIHCGGGTAAIHLFATSKDGSLNCICSSKLTVENNVAKMSTKLF